MSDFTPALPYADESGKHTGGWAGSDASHDRALSDIESTSARQRLVLAYIQFRGIHGATWFELGERMGWHHGRASGILSNLHHDGHLVRLKERRGRSSVYVSPDFVQGRPTAPYGRTRNNRDAYRDGYRDGYAAGLQDSA